jgi:hypothetical protein
MNLIKKYSFKIKSDNFNCLLVYEKGKENGKFHTAIALPPISYGTDIILFGCEVKQYYTHNFDGLIILTTPNYREIYYRGELVTKGYRV